MVCAPHGIEDHSTQPDLEGVLGVRTPCPMGIPDPVSSFVEMSVPMKWFKY